MFQRHWRSKIVIGILFWGVALFLLRKPILREMADFLIKEDRLETADAIYVLSGEFPSRALEAASLFKEKIAPMIILSRDDEASAFVDVRKLGIGPDIAPTQNDLNLRLLTALGVPKERVKLLPEPNLRTASEAKAIVRFIRENRSIHRLLVVTSPAHTRRAGNLMRSSLSETNVEVRIRAARFDRIDPNDWWNHNIERRAVGHEWIAMAMAPFLESR